MSNVLMVIAAFGVACEPWENPPINDGGTKYDCQLLISPDRLEWDIRASDAPADAKDVHIRYTCPDNVPLAEQQPVLLYNLGAFEPAAPGVFRPVNADQAQFVKVAVDDEIVLPIVFDPPHGGTFEATLPIKGGHVSPPEPLRLTGEAAGPSPVLRASSIPDTLRWCESSTTLYLANDGPDRMLIEEVTFGSSEDCSAFAMHEDLGGLEVPPSDSYLAEVTFNPQKLGQHNCNVVVKTDLPTPFSERLVAHANPNVQRTERFTMSDGSGANLLIIYNDDAPENSHIRTRVASGLDTFAAALSEQDVDFRLAAARTGSDLCPAGSFGFVTPLNSPEDVRSTLAESLFDTDNTRGSSMLSLVADTASMSKDNRCFGGWLQTHEPVHVVVISATDDTSGGQVADWVHTIQEGFDTPVSVSVIGPGGCSQRPDRLREAAELTGGTSLDSCLGDWEGIWNTLAVHTARMRRAQSTVLLAETPLKGSIQLSVSGEPSRAFTVVDRTVQLTTQPSDDELVDVQYSPASTCD